MVSSGTNGQYNGRKIIDPTTGKPWQEAGGFEPGVAIPYVCEFASLINSSWKTFQARQYDEAMRDDPAAALAMGNDAWLQSLVDERKLGTASQKWSIEVDNERDPAQKAIKDGLTMAFKSIPDFLKMRWYLLDAIWFGRYGCQMIFAYKNLNLPRLDNPRIREKRAVPVISAHQPVDGDSIGHKHDGTPYITVNGAEANSIPGAEVISATNARAIPLTGNWGNRFLIHRHQIKAGTFFDTRTAERAHGVGIRSVAYWWNWMKMEYLGWLSDYIQRVGLGVKIWKYQAGNKASYDAVSDAAKAQSDKTNLLVPVYDQAKEGVEFLSTSTSGSELILKLLEYIDHILERYIIGQSMSSGDDSDGSLGGSGRAMLAGRTKAKLVAFDCENLAETLSELARRFLRWWYPSDYWDVPVHFKIHTDDVNPLERMQVISAAVQLGLDPSLDAVQAASGLPAAQEGDVTVSQAMAERQQQQMAQQASQMQQMQSQPGGDMSPEDERGLSELEGQLGLSQARSYMRYGEPDYYESGLVKPTGPTAPATVSAGPKTSSSGGGMVNSQPKVATGPANARGPVAKATQPPATQPPGLMSRMFNVIKSFVSPKDPGDYRGASEASPELQQAMTGPAQVGPRGYPIFNDASGKQYLIKKGRLYSPSEEMGARYGKMAGIDVAPVARTKMGGKYVNAVEMLNDAKSLASMEHDDHRRSALAGVPRADIEKHALYDYLIGYTDPHEANYLVRGNKMIAIDKDPAFTYTSQKDLHGKSGTRFIVPHHIEKYLGGKSFQFSGDSVNHMLSAGEKIVADLESNGQMKDAAGVRARLSVLQKLRAKGDAPTVGDLRELGEHGP